MSDLAPDAGAAAPGRPAPWRSRASTALAVAGGLLLVLANLAYWLDATILDSDEFSHKVGAVLRRPEAAQRIGDVLATQALSSGAVQERIARALPQDADFVPLLIETQLRESVAGILSRIVLLDTSAAIIETAVRGLHRLVVTTLEGRDAGPAVQDGALVINLGSLLDGFFARLGIEPPQRLGEAAPGTVVLVEDVRALDRASRLVRAVETAVPILAAATLLVFAAAVALAPRRLAGLRAAGFAVFLAGLVSLLAWRLATWGSSAYLEENTVARLMIESLASNLRLQSIVILVFGGLIVLAADDRSRRWIAAQTSAATSRIEAFGRGRAVLIAGAALALLLLVS